MTTDDERREVAERLRKLPDDSTYPDLIGVIADHDGWYPASDAADRLADLIEPSCDREALLALADKMSRYASLRKRHGMDLDTMVVRAWVSRIREACGEVGCGAHQDGSIGSDLPYSQER